MFSGALLTGGCGYQHQALYPDSVRTVAVPIFDNRSFYRDVEREVTEAVIKEIELRTPYKVVAVDRADSELTGTITQVEQSRLSRGRDGGLVQEGELRIRSNFAWQDRRTGQTLRQRRGLVTIGRYVPARPVSEPYQTAQYQAAQQLAYEIVSVMGAEW